MKTWLLRVVGKFDSKSYYWKVQSYQKKSNYLINGVFVGLLGLMKSKNSALELLVKDGETHVMTLETMKKEFKVWHFQYYNTDKLS